MGIWDELMRQPGFSPLQAVFGAVMYLAWTAAYVTIIYRGFKDRTYGVPWPCIVLNVACRGAASKRLSFCEVPVLRGDAELQQDQAALRVS